MEQETGEAALAWLKYADYKNFFKVDSYTAVIFELAKR